MCLIITQVVNKVLVKKTKWSVQCVVRLLNVPSVPIVIFQLVSHAQVLFY